MNDPIGNSVFTWILTPSRGPGKALTEVNNRRRLGRFYSVWGTLPQARHPSAAYSTECTKYNLELHSHSQQKGRCHNCRIRLGQARDCTLTRMMLAAASTNPHRVRWDRLPAGRTSSPIVVIFCEIGRFSPGEKPKIAKSRSKSILQPWGAKNMTSAKIQPQRWGSQARRIDFDLDFATLKISPRAPRKNKYFFSEKIIN